MVGNDWENSLNAPNSSKSLSIVPRCPKTSQNVPKSTSDASLSGWTCYLFQVCASVCQCLLYTVHNASSFDVLCSSELAFPTPLHPTSSFPSVRQFVICQCLLCQIRFHLSRSFLSLQYLMRVCAFIAQTIFICLSLFPSVLNCPCLLCPLL